MVEKLVICADKTTNPFIEPDKIYAANAPISPVDPTLDKGNERFQSRR